jgi:CRP-like cAMP-binding protein
MNLEVYKKYEQQSVKAGTVIFRERDSADAMYVIVSGRVNISKQIMTGVDKTLSVLEEGEYFGEMSLLLKTTRSATATALEDTTLIRLGRDEFKQILRESPDVGMTMLTQLAERLEKANKEAMLLALELALAEQKPQEYPSTTFPKEQIIVATGSFEVKNMSEVLRRRKELQWDPYTKIITSLMKPGQGQDALLYIIQTDDNREVMKLTSCFKDLVRWTISLAVPTDDELIDTLISS